MKTPRTGFLWLLIAALGLTVLVQSAFPPAPLPGSVIGLREVSLKFEESDLATLVRVDPTNREVRIATYQGRVIHIPIDAPASSYLVRVEASSEVR